jgi:hypothetical protein
MLVFQPYERSYMPKVEVAKPRNYTIPPLAISSVTPPKVHRTGRPSPYAPTDQVPAMFDALVQARTAKDASDDKDTSAWVSFLSAGLTSEQRARNALGSIRKAVAAYAELDSKAFAGRTWQIEDEWYFALQLRPGALDTED